MFNVIKDITKTFDKKQFKHEKHWTFSLAEYHHHHHHHHRHH